MTSRAGRESRGVTFGATKKKGGASCRRKKKKVQSSHSEEVFEECGKADAQGKNVCP